MLIKVRIGDLGDIYTGNTPSKSIEEYYESNDIMFIKPDIMSFNIENITKSNEYISEKARKKARIIPKNSLLVSCIGNIGKLAINSEEASFNQQINAIVHNNRIISSKYLAYLLKYNQKKMELIANAPVVPIINKTQFSNFEVFINKDLETQKKIEEVLDRAQFLIDKRKEQIDLLDELVKSKFIEMFGDPKFNKFNWKMNRLGDIFNIVSGGTPKTNIKEYWNQNDYSWIGSNLCQDNVLYKNDGKYISKLGLEKSSAKVLSPNTVLVAMVGATIGKTALLKFETTTNQNIAGIKVHESHKYSPEFVYYYMQNCYYKFLEVGGDKFKMASLGFIKNIEIYDIPIELQNQFTDFVKQVEKLKFEMEKSLKELKDNFDSLMQKAFKGELFND